MSAVGWAITHRRQHTSMLAEGPVNSVYFKFLQRPDPIIVFVSQFLFASGCSCCFPSCTTCLHLVRH